MSRDREPLTKSSGFASKTPNADGGSLLPLRIHSRGKSPGSSHFRKDREVAKQCAQRASFSVHGTGLRCCEGGCCFCCADRAVEVEVGKDRAEQRRHRRTRVCGDAASQSELHLSSPVIQTLSMLFLVAECQRTLGTAQRTRPVAAHPHA